jgi:hypothetical protein
VLFGILTDLPASLNLPKLDKRITGLVDSGRDGVCRLGLTLGSDDCSLTLLLGLFDDKLGSFGVLLRDLLLLDGRGELFTECHVGLESLSIHSQDAGGG